MRSGEYPPGVPCWIDSEQPDPQAAVAFYGALLGWEFEDRVPPQAPGHYFIARLGGLVVGAIGSRPEGAGDAAPAWNTYVCVDGADTAARRVADAGGSVLTPPSDVPGAGRMGVCADPSGGVFRVWEPRERTGAQLVNAPGSWNWSDLHTRDAERATAFYGAVFGWQAAAVEFGDALMWRLPGYGDFLAQRDPDLRRRHAEGGAPEGFGDAIGWLIPAPADDDLASRWSVTFAVADTDAVAGTAARLGGTVVVAPHDVGGVARVAVLDDPQGARFIVSAYMPG